MPEVVIVGGGLSGLSAAWELHRQHVPFTLIEVKNRLGGGLASTTAAGYTFDTGPMTYPAVWDWSFLDDLGVARLNDSRADRANDSRVTLAGGAGALIDALAARCGFGANPLMLRMAVHSIGVLEESGRSFFGICLENGILLDARAVIIAAPARYAEPMFRQLQPEIAYRLLDFRYDTITRVSLGYSAADVPTIPSAPPEDYPITGLRTLHGPPRTPMGSLIVQVDVRHEWIAAERRDLVGEIAALFGWSPQPEADLIGYWSESDPLFVPNEHGRHAQNMDAVRHLLPEGVGLAGSDYALTDDPASVSLADRVAMGRAAAQRALDGLRR